MSDGPPQALEHPDRLRGWHTHWTEGQELGHRVRLDLYGMPVVVRSNEARVVERMRGYYRPFAAGGDDAAGAGGRGGEAIRLHVVDGPARRPDLDFRLVPRPPGKEPKDAYVSFPDGRMVRKLRTGVLFLVRKDAPHLATGPCLEQLNQLINFLNARFMQRHFERGAVPLHAGAVARHGRGLALAGGSDVGKSTLTLRMVSRGLDFVTNDRVLLYDEDEEGSVPIHGVPKLPRVNPGTILENPHLHRLLDPSARKRYRQLPYRKLWERNEKYHVLVHRLFGRERLRPRATLGALVVLTWQPGGGAMTTRSVPLGERAELLQRAAKGRGPYCDPGRTDPPTDPISGEFYADRLASVSVVEVGGGVNVPAAAELLETLVDPPGEASPGRPLDRSGG